MGIPRREALCTSDTDGDCSFTVPDTNIGGATYNRFLWVKEVATPGADWFSNPALRTGGTSQATPYAFQVPMATGQNPAGLRPNTTYSSQAQFMIGSGSSDRTASGGIWQVSPTNPELPDTCGFDVALVLDLSGSAANVEQLRDAADTEGNEVPVAAWAATQMPDTGASLWPLGAGSAFLLVGLAGVAFRVASRRAARRNGHCSEPGGSSRNTGCRGASAANSSSSASLPTSK